jgi:hypothetical protein
MTMRDPLPDLDRLFEELISMQRDKVLGEARRRDPKLTSDDIEQPHDFPVLAADPAWQYEDGILAGYRAAHMAVRARLRSEREDR